MQNKFDWKRYANWVVICFSATLALLPTYNANGQASPLNPNRSQTLSERHQPPQPTGTNYDCVRPYALLLPGILGEQFWDKNIKAGIEKSNFSGDVEIYDWTLGPLAMGLNMGGNARQVQYLTNRIQEFKQAYPNRPLYLIGHSGGCRMAVLTMEQLPDQCQINRAVLLSPCMDSNYDLRLAMNHTSNGIVAFNSPLDIPISLPLTAAQGLFHGKVKMSAAVFGFRFPKQILPEEKPIYQKMLSQKQYRPDMLGTGHIGGHFGWTVPEFVSQYVVPSLSPSR